MWRDTAAMPEYGRLEGDVRTDVLVIGGGMAGILCAHFLRQAGMDCVLAEADRLCAGTTGNTTAKITSQHGLVYDGLLRRFGAEKAGMYLHANEAALARYRGMCREIDCGFEEKDAFVYSLDDRGKLEKELAALEKLGFHAGFTDKLPLPFPVAGAVRSSARHSSTHCALPRPRPEGCGPTSTRPCAGWRGRAPLPTAGRSARRRSSWRRIFRSSTGTEAIF